MNGEDEEATHPDVLDWSAPFPELLRLALPAARVTRGICPEDRYAMGRLDLRTRRKFPHKPPCRKYICGCKRATLETWSEQAREHVMFLADYWHPADPAFPSLMLRWDRRLRGLCPDGPEVDAFIEQFKADRRSFIDRFWLDDAPRVFWTRYPLTGDADVDKRTRANISDRLALAKSPWLRFDLHDGWCHVLSTKVSTNRTGPTEGRWLCGADACWLVRRLLSHEVIIMKKPSASRAAGRNWQLVDPPTVKNPDAVTLGELPAAEEDDFFYSDLEYEIGVDLRTTALPDEVSIGAARMAWADTLEKVKIWRGIG